MDIRTLIEILSSLNPNDEVSIIHDDGHGEIRSIYKINTNDIEVILDTGWQPDSEKCYYNTNPF